MKIQQVHYEQIINWQQIFSKLLNYEVFWSWWKLLQATQNDHTHTWWNGLKIWKTLANDYLQLYYSSFLIFLSYTWQNAVNIIYTHTNKRIFRNIVIYIHVVIYIIYLQNLALESYKMLFFFFCQTLGLTCFRGKILNRPIPCYHVCHIILVLV